MQQLQSLEQALAGVFKDAPHLPKGFRVWVVENAWWLVLIGVVLSVLGATGLLLVVVIGSALAGKLAGVMLSGVVTVSTPGPNT